MGHILLLYLQNEINENNLFTITTGYQILYYNQQIQDLPPPPPPTLLTPPPPQQQQQQQTEEIERERKEENQENEQQRKEDEEEVEESNWKCALLGVPVEMSQDV